MFGLVETTFRFLGMCSHSNPTLKLEAQQKLSYLVVFSILMAILIPSAIFSVLRFFEGDIMNSLYATLQVSAIVGGTTSWMTISFNRTIVREIFDEIEKNYSRIGKIFR